jgi:flagellar motor switch protein FliG
LIQTTISGFEDLRWLAPSSLQAVLGAVDSRLWAPALRGASRELSERILTHMPARAAVLLRHEIEFPGPVRLGDVETAQHEILEVVRRLDHTGDLVLEDRQEIRQ